MYGGSSGGSSGINVQKSHAPGSSPEKDGGISGGSSGIFFQKSLSAVGKGGGSPGVAAKPLDEEDDAAACMLIRK